MTGNINLTTSMRTNLLSLQQISKLQDRTQLRLSTGLKVNSAIDNPSSYYTAQSLNNRADDLSALLDSMGQGIQTIKAASEGIETAEDLVTQMKAIAEQVNTSGTYVPDKEYFIKKVGENGAVVSTAEELRQAIADNKETICVYGKIDLGDISTTGGLSLQEYQKLVGVEYFGNFIDGEGFSSISATDSVVNHALIDIQKTGCLVSDLNLNYKNSATTGGAYGINVQGTNVVADIQNLDINVTFDENNGSNKTALYIQNNATVNLEEKINIQTSGKAGYGIFVLTSSTCNVLSKAQINISSEYGIHINQYSTINTDINTTINIDSQFYGISLYYSANLNINGLLELNTKATNRALFFDGGGSTLNVLKTASIFFNSETSIWSNAYNNINISSGAKLAFEKNNSTKWYKTTENYQVDDSSSTIHIISYDNIETTLNVTSTSSWQTPADIIAEQEKEEAEKAEAEKKSYETYQKQFNNALSQYDMLINDSAYKGINLLKEDTLKVNFNEDKSAHLLIQGVDMTSEGIGLLSADWNTDKDVQTSLEQVLSVQKKLRSAATKLGNCYSIVSERQNFTENLINVLTEGADKLTLADMNEESANMLALQTQQQLAINSLSLASQASQGVLRLF